MIKSFHDRRTAALFQGKALKGTPAELVRTAQKKLQRIDAARSLDDLRAFRNDNLHPLERDRAGQWAIKVNDQFRICFVWQDDHAERVEFCDYH